MLGILPTSVLLLIGLLQPVVAQEQPAQLAKQMLKSLGSAKGLCVVLGSTDGRLAVELSHDGQYLVHGLCTSQKAVAQARQSIDAADLRGVVSAEVGVMKRLPYSDNIVNMIVVENTSELLRDDLLLTEVMRVLRPGGMAWLADSGSGDDAPSVKWLNELTESYDLVEPAVSIQEPTRTWIGVKKPRPKSMDAWTHQRRDGSGNPVSTDTQVGVPTGVRWVAGPNWPTGDRKASTPSAVASDQYLAVVFQDEVTTPDGKSREDSLIVRDVFNGMRLWRRKAESMDLVSTGGRVYTKVGGKLVALDGQTGDVVQTFDVAGPEEFLITDGMVIVTSSSGTTALNAESGELRWSAELRAENMRVGDGRLFVHVDNSRRGSDSQLVCLDVKSGEQVWEASTKSWAKGSSFKLILHSHGVLVTASKYGNHAISADDGTHLWNHTYPRIGHGGSFEKIMASGGLVWIHTADSQGSKQYAWEGLDPQTGELKQRLLQPKEFTYKHRCSYDVGTEQLFLCGSMDFADLKTGKYHHFGASRTSCRTAGLIPANGLIYTFPHACGCYAMLRGFLALETRPEFVPAPTAAERLEKGPAFDTAKTTSESPSTDWPTYRRDVTRSASSATPGPTSLSQLWERVVADRVPEAVALEWGEKDGGRVTSPVVAGGLAFVAGSDHHRLLAFDANSGEPAWSFTTGGRIDCPPTINSGLCLFGSHDGYVYCLTADKGELVWRFRAAPRARRIVAYGQLESARPVVGGVLVHDGLAYFVIGRHSASDGGLLVQAVKPQTGELIWAEPVTGHDGVPDVLTGGDGTIQMAGWKVNAKTGQSTSDAFAGLRGGRLGILNAAWAKRPIAIRRNLSQWQTGDRPTGQMLTFNDEATCGYRACGKVNTGNGQMSGNAVLFAKAMSGREWSVEMPTTARMRGMVLAGDRLYVAGLLYEDEKGTRATNGVRVYNLADGKLLSEHAIEDPLMHDCLAIADGRLYVSTQSRLICLGAQ